MSETKRRAKGEGSFTLNSNGSVTHRKTVGYKASGYRKILTVTAPSKEAAIKKMAEKERKWKNQEGNNAEFSNMTLSALCRRHLQYQVENHELKSKSVDRREVTIERQISDFPIGRRLVSEVKGGDIEDHINFLMRETKLSVSSITKTIDVIHASYAWAVRRGDLERNPAVEVRDSLKKKLQKKKVKDAGDTDVVFMSSEETERFVNEANKRAANGVRRYKSGDPALLLLYTGMRIGELIALHWEDVDWKAGTVRINKTRSVVKNRGTTSPRNYIQIEGSTKNEKARTICLSEKALEILRSIQKTSNKTGAADFIIIGRTGKPRTVTSMEHSINTIYANAGLPYSGLHVLRRTFASMMYASGARTKEIAAYIGDLESTTRQYYIGIREKVLSGGNVVSVVRLPGS